MQITALNLWSIERASVVQVATACFVQPPLCYVGLTEEQAERELSGDVDVYVSKFKPMKNTLSGRDEKTLMKLIVHVPTDEVRRLLPKPSGLLRQNSSPCLAMLHSPTISGLHVHRNTSPVLFMIMPGLLKLSWTHQPGLHPSL